MLETSIDFKCASKTCKSCKIKYLKYVHNGLCQRLLLLSSHFFIHSAISQRDWRQTEKYTVYFDHTRAETLERIYAYVACKSEMATNIITTTGDRLINQYRHKIKH